METHALLADSPAIDKEDNDDVYSAEPVNNLDQRGFPRPVDGGGDGTATCDIGAYEVEFPPPPAVGGLEFLADNSGLSTGGLAALAGSAAGAIAILAVGGWYARRRWLRRS